MPSSFTYEAETTVPLSANETFNLFVDAIRYPEWQRALKRVVDLSGSTADPGTTYVLDHGLGGKVRVTVLDVDKPRLYRLRQQGWRSDATVTVRFVSRSADITNLLYTAEVAATRFSRLLPPPTKLIVKLINGELDQFRKWIERTQSL